MHDFLVTVRDSTDRVYRITAHDEDEAKELVEQMTPDELAERLHDLAASEWSVLDVEPAPRDDLNE